MATLPSKGFTPSVISFESFKRDLNPLPNMAGYSKPFCDQLAAIGHPVDDSDQFHWFFCGLGPSFETFSTSIRSARPAPSFADLLDRTESHELFYQALHRSSSPTVAFTATHQPQPSAGRGRGGRSSRAPNQYGGRGRGRRPPHNVVLNGVLVVPRLTKNLLSVSKLNYSVLRVLRVFSSFFQLYPY